MSVSLRKKSTKINELENLDCFAEEEPILHTNKRNKSNDILCPKNIPKYKVIVIGDHGVGKSSIMCRSVFKKFEENIPSTIGIDFQTKTIILFNQEFHKLNVWDLAGQERFRALMPAYFRYTHCVILVYDCSQSYDEQRQSILRWMEEIENHCPKNVKKILVCNKVDLIDEMHSMYYKKRKFIYDEVKYFSQEQKNLEKLSKEFKFDDNKMCSAKSNLNVYELFQSVALHCSSLYRDGLYPIDSCIDTTDQENINCYKQKKILNLQLKEDDSIIDDKYYYKTQSNQKNGFCGC